jgi:hypothetical protein
MKAQFTKRWHDASIAKRVGFVLSLPFVAIIGLAISPIALIAWSLYSFQELTGLED